MRIFAVVATAALAGAIVPITLNTAVAFLITYTAGYFSGLIHTSRDVG